MTATITTRHLTAPHPVNGDDLTWNRMKNPQHATTPGTLWERASTEDKSATDRHGWFLAYYVCGGDTRLPGVHDTYDEAVASIDRVGRLLGYQVAYGPRYTKSGKAYRFASREEATA